MSAGSGSCSDTPAPKHREPITSGRTFNADAGRRSKSLPSRPPDSGPGPYDVDDDDDDDDDDDTADSFRHKEPRASSPLAFGPQGLSCALPCLALPWLGLACPALLCLALPCGAVLLSVVRGQRRQTRSAVSFAALLRDGYVKTVLHTCMYRFHYAALKIL